VTGQFLGLAALVALILWLAGRAMSRRRASGEAREPIDRAELEAAEREVRNLGSSARADEGFAGDDWGPGAAGRRDPE
jgi:hypothetical protein